MTNNKNKNETKTENWLYVIGHAKAPGIIKIGYSKNNPDERGGRIEHLTFLMRAFFGKCVCFSIQHEKAKEIEVFLKVALGDLKRHFGNKGDSTEIYSLEFESGKTLLKEAIFAYGKAHEWSEWQKKCREKVAESLNKKEFNNVVLPPEIK